MHTLNFDKLLQNHITILWGNPGIGKTFQLKNYHQKHKNKSLYIHFTDFATKIKENLDVSIDVVLLDSLDELLGQYSQEDIAGMLIKYIQKCTKINTKIKFIFSSRAGSYITIAKELALRFNDLHIIEFPSYNPSKQTFENIINHRISVIIGEPASGKTFQLREYAKDNQKSYFVELVTIEDEIEIQKNIDIVLLDSIDEALIDYSNFKKLNSKLVKYINLCRSVNPQVKFVISCRALEWKEYFAQALENIDDDMKIYDILPLDEKDVNELLTNRKISQEEFWEFIKENHIEALLKNIMVLFHIVNKFTVYKKSSLSYIDIYKDIIKEHISKKGEDREDIIWDDPIDKYILIASSLASYMILNRVQYIELDHLPILADELYQINSVPVIASDIKKVLSTTLFERKGDRVDFYHKSIKEYLTANFVYQKNLDMVEVKDLFSHNLRFYEEFEEIIIYLTNLSSVFFDEFVVFDPYIFRRHPSLNSAQQKKLFDSMICKLTDEEQTAWGKWDYLENSTLVKLDKLDNLVSHIKKKVDIHKINYPVYIYLLNILKENHSIEMENFFFYILEVLKEDTQKCYKYIKDLKLDDYQFNSRLYNFIKENKLLNFDKDTIQFENLEMHLFKKLYAFDKMAFSELIQLLECIPSYSFKHVVKLLSPLDCQLWFDNIKKRYKNSKEYNDYKSTVLSWAIYGLLRNYKIYSSKSVMQNILNILSHPMVHIQSNMLKDKLDENTLDFNDIADDFWDLFFNNEYDRNRVYALEALFVYYDITIEDIAKVINKYPIENYIEYYITFRMKIPDIDTILMKNNAFKAHMEEIWAKHAKDDDEREKEDAGKDWYINKQTKKEEYYLRVSSFNSSEDLYYIFSNAYRYGQGTELNEKLKNDLKGNYSKFIDMAKDEFISDATFKNIKEDIKSNSILYSTLLFEFLFSVISIDSIKSLINSSDDYKKLFWHLYKYRGLDTEYFKQLTEVFFDEFISLTSEMIELSLIQSDNHSTGIDYEIIHLLKELDKFNKNSIEPIIQKLSTIPISSYKLLDETDRGYAFQFLTLDINQYNFIKNMMKKDEEHCADYLKALVILDTNKAIEYFNDTYKDMPKYIIFDTKTKISHPSPLLPRKQNYYNNEHINTKKINYYLCLIRALKSTRHKEDGIGISILKSEYLKMIIQDYYTFFKNYQRPTGTYSPGICDDMYDYINKLWQYVETSTEQIKLLKELSGYDNKILSTRAKYALEQAYNQQGKNREYLNSYYKNIFDKKQIKTVGDTHIHGDVYGVVTHEGELHQNINKQETQKDLDNEIWYKKIPQRIKRWIQAIQK